MGTGIITITALPGEGFTGSVSKTFKIVGASVENASVKVDNGVYTGEAVTPAFTVSLAGRTLTEGVDFRADFSNNINVTDSAVLTITGINNYGGTKNKCKEAHRCGYKCCISEIYRFTSDTFSDSHPWRSNP